MRVFTSVSLRRMALSLCTAALLITAQPVNAHHGGAHILNVYSLTCWQNNDPIEAGADEPYLKLNGSRIWTGPDCRPKTTLRPGVNTTFWNQASLYIMEDDFGRDDQVGHVLVGSQAGQGTKTYYSMKWVNGFGYFFNYTMDYEVK